jgi:hypothetical protein
MKEIEIPAEYIPVFGQCRVGIHLKHKTERNPTVVVAAMYTSDHRYERNWRHKGIDPNTLIERPMTDKEYDRIKNTWRLHWYGYETYEGLIEDEYEATNDIKWVKKLFAALNMSGDLLNILGLPSESGIDLGIDST